MIPHRVKNPMSWWLNGDDLILLIPFIFIIWHSAVKNFPLSPFVYTLTYVSIFIKEWPCEFLFYSIVKKLLFVFILRLFQNWPVGVLSN